MTGDLLGLRVKRAGSVKKSKVEKSGGEGVISPELKLSERATGHPTPEERGEREGAGQELRYTVHLHAPGTTWRGAIET